MNLVGWLKRFLVSMILSTGLLTGAACGPANDSNLGEGGKADVSADQPMFAFVINVPGRFWDLAHAGCLTAAEEEGARLEFYVPGQSSAAQQKQIVESLIAKGCNGLAISPLNPESMGRLLDEASEYMPVICQDSDAPNSKRICYIGTDNVAAGRAAGKALKGALPGGGEVALFVGKLDVANARERHQGVIEALEGSQCTVVETFTDQADRSRAQSNVRAALAKYPDLRGIVGLWGYNGPAAVMALRDQPGHDIKVVSFDEDIEALEGVRRDDMVCTIAQNPYQFGYQSIKMLARLHRGEPVELPDDRLIFIAVRVITKENVDAFEKDVDAKLSRLKKLKLY
jgi:ribose transport system substrate-binding protein